MTSPIDYANAVYTRVYNEDTAELEFAGWEARALLWHLQRRMSQSGVFRFGAMPMVPFIVRRTGIPADVVERSLALLLDSNVLVLREGALVDPEFIAAQTASKSNKQRQREFRDRHRDEALSSPPPANDGQEALAEGPEPRNESLRVTDVTPGIATHRNASHCEVTVSLSDPDTAGAREEADAYAKVISFRPPLPPPPYEALAEAAQEAAAMRPTAGMSRQAEQMLECYKLAFQQKWTCGLGKVEASDVEAVANICFDAARLILDRDGLRYSVRSLMLFVSYKLVFDPYRKWVPKFKYFLDEGRIARYLNGPSDNVPTEFQLVVLQDLRAEKTAEAAQ